MVPKGPFQLKPSYDPIKCGTGKIKTQWMWNPGKTRAPDQHPGMEHTPSTGINGNPDAAKRNWEAKNKKKKDKKKAKHVITLE